MSDGQIAKCSHGRMVTSPHGLMVRWFPGHSVRWPFCPMVRWSHGCIVRWPNGHMNEGSPKRMVKWLDGHMAKWSDSLKVTRSNNQIVRWPDGSTTSAPSLKGCAILNPKTCPKIPPGHEGRPRINPMVLGGGGTDPGANTNLRTKLGHWSYHVPIGEMHATRLGGEC